MKLVLTDSYDRETVADILLYPHLHPWIANWMCEEMQNLLIKDGHTPDYWPRVFEDHERLWRGMEELV